MSSMKNKTAMESSEKMDSIDLNSCFCIEMANHVLLKEAEKGLNFVISPVSFQIMLSLVAMGSTGNTLDQLLFYLGSESIDDVNTLTSQIVSFLAQKYGDEQNHATDPLVTLVNGAWVDRRFGLKTTFEAILRNSYKAEAKEVDFLTKAIEVTKEVNSWAENATKGLIKELLPLGSLDSDTALVFANALYFKGAWDRKFDAEKTTNKDFHLLNGHIVQVPFMTTKRSERHLYCRLDGYKILRVPYQNSYDTRQFSMYFFLPEDNNGLPILVQKLNSTPGFFSQSFQLHEQDLGDRFWIPRFKFSFEFEASESIKELGLQLPFMDAGEFTEMVDSPHGDKVCLSKIFHKSYIEANEEGTEAAASTAVRFRKCSAIIPPPGFVADHPFMFMIREETSRIVFFIGTVLNPLLAT